MKIFLAALFFFLCASTLSAQNDSAKMQPKNVVFVEAGGNAMGYSINYSRIFWNTHTPTCMVRAGFEYMVFNEGDEFQFPMEGSLLIGKKRHFINLGVGLTIFSHVIYPHISPGGMLVGIEPYTERINGANGCIRIGYCFIPLYKKNLAFSIAFTPLYVNRYTDNGMYEHGSIIPWGGASLGYAF